MPCDSSHLKPTHREVESVKLISLLKEVGIAVGGHDRNYGDEINLDLHTNQLCEFCQSNDVTQYSLELQIWWRDHQAADRKRLEREQAEAKTEEEKQVALAKLTDYERKLLGLE